MKWYKDLKEKWLKSQEEKFEEEFREHLSQLESGYKSAFETKEHDLQIEKNNLDSEFQKVDQMKEELRIQKEWLLSDDEEIQVKKEELRITEESIQNEIKSITLTHERDRSELIKKDEDEISKLMEDYTVRIENSTKTLKEMESKVLERNKELESLNQELQDKGLEILEKIESMEKKLIEAEGVYQKELQEFETKLAKLKSEHEIRLSYENRLIAEAEFQVKQKKEETAYLEVKLNDRKNELEQANQDLKEQVRVLEAKAKPDSVWAEAFAAGHDKAWDFTIPILLRDYETMKKKIHDDAVDETLNNLDSVVIKRMDDLGKTNLKTNLELVKKREDFELKLSKSANEQEKIKYRSFIEAINWALNGNIIQTG